MPAMKVVASLGTGRAGAGAVAAGQPGQQRSREWISHEGPRSVGLPASPCCRGAWPGYCFADKVFESTSASRGGGHLLRGHKLLMWRRRDCFFTQSRCFQHASSSVGNLVQ